MVRTRKYRPRRPPRHQPADTIPLSCSKAGHIHLVGALQVARVLGTPCWICQRQSRIPDTRIVVSLEGA